MDKATKFAIDEEIKDNQILSQKFISFYNDSKTRLHYPKIDNPTSVYKENLNKIYSAKNFPDEESFKVMLLGLKENKGILNLEANEKNDLLNRIDLQMSMIQWMKKLIIYYAKKDKALFNAQFQKDNANVTARGFCKKNGDCPRGYICCHYKCVLPVRGLNGRYDECPDYFSIWGKCILSIQAGSIGGGLTGGQIGGVGCTVVIPGVGTVACGAVGAVIGTVGGAIAGLAAGCFD